MKNRFRRWFGLLLLLLGMGSAVMVYTQVKQIGNQVVLTTVDQAGDAQAAQGLSVSWEAKRDQGKLVWKTTWKPGDRAETSWSVLKNPPGTYEEEYYWEKKDKNGDAILTFGFDGNTFASDVLSAIKSEDHSVVTTGWSDGLDTLDPQLFSAIEEACGKVDAGDVGKFLIPLAKYVDNYPLSLQITTSDNSVMYRPDEINQLSEIMQIPAEDGAMELTITKNTDGTVGELGYRTQNDCVLREDTQEEEDYDEEYALDHPEDDAILSYPYGRCTPYGLCIPMAAVNGRGPRGGQGIYRIPYNIEEDPEDPTEISYEDAECTLNFSGAEKIYTLEDSQAQILNMFGSADREYLYLLTREEGYGWVTVVSSSDGDELQRLCMGENYDLEISRSFVNGDSITILFDDGHFQTMIMEDGMLQIACEGQLPKAEDLGAEPNVYSIYDDERDSADDSSMVNRVDDCVAEGTKTAFGLVSAGREEGFILVYDTDQLVYRERFVTNLSDELYSEDTYNVFYTENGRELPYYRDRIYLQWKEE